jgi:elongator complex protein 1
MSWSPDQELVVFATGAKTLLTMTKDFEILVENAIDAVPLKSLTSTTNAANILLSKAQDPSRVSISWRADGQMFAVNSVDDDGSHWIRMWERDGTLFSKTEPVQGLEHNLHYRPDGSIIGATQYLSNKAQTNVLFFERNGLQHYDFQLDKGQANVKSIQWNITSDVLCVHFTPSGKSEDVVQLWFRNNYHWYLKQELVYPTVPSLVYWDQEVALRLHVFVEASYFRYDYTWDHSSPTVLKKENACVMAVIDGPNVRFTPFRFALVPPPMYTDSITCSSNVNRVSFYDVDTLLVQLSNGSIEIYKLGSNNKPPKFGLPPNKVGDLKIENEEHDRIRRLRLVTLVSNDTFYGVDPSEGSRGDTLVRVVFSSEDLSIVAIEEIPYPEKLMQLVYHDATQKLFVEAVEGALFEQPIDDLPIEREESFLQPCQVVSACIMGDGEEVLVGLTDRGVLFIQSNIAASNCSSFALHDKFLLFTTYAHKLRLIPLYLNVHDAMELAVANPVSKFDETFREIERGAKLVRVVPQDIRVVLQMPRGNLEGIYPKAIILAHLSNLLNNFDYGTAVTISRKYILDMNLIYDHNPKEFLKRAEEFVDKVETPDYLNLFISELRNGDVTLEKYGGYVRDPNATPTSDDYEQKVGRVCRALRDALEKKPTKKYITSLLTTYAKNYPPQLEEALEKIRSLRVDELQSGRETSLSESALKYLIFLADVSLLYDTALGMYDFDLVLLVAQNSQKDPKEYLPFLADLQKQETYLQRYNINMYLSRFERALQNIVLAGPEHFELSLKLIKTQKLFKPALELYKSDADKLKIIYEAYGDYLQSVNEYQQAAFAYMQSGNLEKAQEAFKEAGMYKYAFTLCKELKQSDSEIRYLAQDIVTVLSRQENIVGAAFVTREYLKDDEEAILILTKNCVWDEALRIAHISKRTDLIETHIKYAINEAYEERISEFESNKEKLVKYLERLGQLREEKRKLLEEQLRQQMQNDDEFGEDMPRDLDAFSDTSSVQSGASGYSGVSVLSTTSVSSHYSDRTERNKKKRTKLRKGSPFEEDNLVSRIASLIPIDENLKDVHTLLEALLYFGNLSDAKKLQVLLRSILAIVYEHQALYEEPFLLPLVEQQKVPIQKIPRKVKDIVGDVQWELDLLDF